MSGFSKAFTRPYNIINTVRNLIMEVYEVHSAIRWYSAE